MPASHIDGPFKDHIITWARSGIIAYADNESDSHNLCITYLESLNDQNWRLTPPKKYTIHNIPINGTNSTKLFHNLRGLYWNNRLNSTSDYLAIYDEVGNLTIVRAGLSPKKDSIPIYEPLNVLSIVYQDQIAKIFNEMKHLEPQTTGLEKCKIKKLYNSSIVAFDWFVNDKPIAVGGPGAKTNGLLHNTIQQYKPYGVVHPTSIGVAGCGLRRDGSFTIWYYAKTFKKISISLGIDMVDLAEIGYFNEPNAIMVVTYTGDKLKIYKVKVDWSSPEPTVSSSLYLQETISNVIGIKVISPNFSTETVPEIFVQCEDKIVRRYNLTTTIHDAFKNIGQPLSHTPVSLSLQNEFKFEKPVLHIDARFYESFVLFFLSGEIVMYNRRTWKLEVEKSDATHVTSLMTVGFKFPEFKSIVQVSPYMAGMLELDNGILKYSPVEKSSPISEMDARVLGFWYMATNGFSSYACDEMLILIQKYVKNDKVLVAKTLEQAQASTLFNQEITRESFDKFISMPATQRLFGLNMLIGSEHVSIMSRAFINLRKTLIALVTVGKFLAAPQITPLMKLDALYSITDTCQWLSVFITSIFQQLVLALNNQPNWGLPFLCSRFSRMLLFSVLANCKKIVTVKPVQEGAIQLEILTSIQAIFSSIDMPKFEGLLSKLDGSTPSKPELERCIWNTGELPSELTQSRDKILADADLVPDMVKYFFADISSLRLLPEDFSIITPVPEKLTLDISTDDLKMPKNGPDDITAKQNMPITKRCVRCRMQTSISYFNQDHGFIPSALLEPRRWYNVHLRCCPCGGTMVSLVN